MVAYLINSLSIMETGPTPGKRRIAKPLGIYVIALFDGIAIGLFPLILLIYLDLDNDPSIEIPVFAYYLTAALRVVVVAAALGAMMGENLGRRVLLGAVTSVSISMIFNTVYFPSTSPDAVAKHGGVLGNITRGTFWIIVNWWYFNRKEVVAYYMQQKEANRHSSADHQR